jgi:predicted nucleic acid-binding protein
MVDKNMALPSNDNPDRLAGPMRFMLDSNVSHALVDDDKLRLAVRRAADRGFIALLVTHIQVDENLDHPDPDQGRRLIHALIGTGARTVPTYGLALQASRPEHAMLFDEAMAGMFEAFRRGNPKHTQDGLLAATALHETAILVTAENEKHRRRLRRFFPGLEVWGVNDLQAFLDDLENQTPIGEFALAAGTLMTPAFVGPGAVEASVRINLGMPVPPQLNVSLELPRSRAGFESASTIVMQRIEPAAGGGVQFTVTVRRTSRGDEPARVFRWELAPEGVTRTS